MKIRDVRPRYQEWLDARLEGLMQAALATKAAQ
jgi:hypothetical protein